MTQIAVIGGSGLDKLDSLLAIRSIKKETPYGEHSPGVVTGTLKSTLGERECVFLPRHGDTHKFPPDKINYRANIWLLKSLGVEKAIAINVVGGISDLAAPEALVIPDQIIDYTSGRDHTYFDGDSYDDPFLDNAALNHIDFSFPYSSSLRDQLIDFLQQQHVEFVDGGTYGCTQGPRLETSAEIQSMKIQGCSVVGMTAMPEAALARELSIEYCSLCPVVNWAAGIGDEILSLDTILQACDRGIANIMNYLPEMLNYLK